ncbi:hypothetical protein E2C01_017982 [Portunus trituberculatus]|uniref:Uncharacterized protein n=1 Tax=Portunus trituberculatus TaxID=210409 RepID=A0A5B7DTX6_PORTR|nr:hypothetical protein [Portunus trituberculatus]
MTLARWSHDPHDKAKMLLEGVTVLKQHPPASQHRIPCNMALPTSLLLNMTGHIGLPIPPEQDSDEYYVHG